MLFYHFCVSSSSIRNQGNCPICRGNFNLNRVIPLLMDGIVANTSTAVNQSTHVETKRLLLSIKDSLNNVNTCLTEIKDRLTVLEAGSLNLSPSSSHVELKTRDAIIESLKMHVERMKQPKRGIYYNQNCIDRGHSSNYDDSGINQFVGDLEDDELEFNLSIN